MCGPAAGVRCGNAKTLGQQRAAIFPENAWYALRRLLLQRDAPAVHGDRHSDVGNLLFGLARSADNRENQCCNEFVGLIAMIDLTLLRMLFTSPHDLAAELAA